ncbi:hypothetical protein Psal071_01040 [Piscirickettsia salmonis]|uniref:Lipoprotein n=2 Tax=Piscirickettsia salmonis TaxID=1238 RepID=A0A9Q6PSB4_PISSA|nr:hypothetical protein [Piscirickettsia salmonis]QGN95639.1 hypothetical protein Psal006a_02259 [Piscirickettsia salmonis]QGO05412.1 hypothetical protein Psal009_01301 [Piscirickettsia salmonis]QGO33733.1 hypothetical protein Psal028_01048 [Piscirickettsia salmonis]QGO37343.1 hypothetical protein Psal040_01046 [Piscirickettsia salmonis]QGO40969.1 hypothetical protein Psal041_01047 [Piscirickettsia salmonis]
MMKRSHNIFGYLIAFFAVIFLVACTNTPLKVANDNFRLAGASKAHIDSYGRVMKHISKRYEVDGYFKTTVAVRQIAQEMVDEEFIEKFKAALRFERLNPADGDRLQRAIERDPRISYTATVFVPKYPNDLEKRLAQAFNESPVLRHKMKNPDFRFISSFIVVSAHGQAKYRDFDIKPQFFFGGSQKEKLYNLSNDAPKSLLDGSVFAYQYKVICWRHGFIYDTVLDEIGVKRPACPPGSSALYPGRAEQWKS